MLHQPSLRALLLDDVAEVAGVGEQLVRVSGPGDRPGLAAASEHPVDCVEQVERPERLSHQGVCAGGARVGLARLAAGEHDHARRSKGRVLLQFPAEGETARTRHVHVEHDERRPPEPRDRGGLLGRRGLLDRVLVRGERRS